MNERIRDFGKQAYNDATGIWPINSKAWYEVYNTTFAELIVEDMHKKVIASILITDVVMEEKGQVPTSEDYIRAINKDFGVEE